MQFLNSEKQAHLKSKLTETSDGVQRLYHTGRRRGRHFVSKRSIGIVRFWRSLTFAQRCYLVATGMGVLGMYFNVQSAAFDVVMYAFALAGIVNEIWPRFMIVWHSLPGKAVILFVYAIIANFALASASGMVNDIAGVSASALPYSHNFALILTMPTWFFITSIMALLLLILLTPLYMMVLLVLKPFGVKRIWHPPEYRFVLTTTFIRFIWTILLLVEFSLLSAQAGLMWEDEEQVASDMVSVQFAYDSFVQKIAEQQKAQKNEGDLLSDEGAESPGSTVKLGDETGDEASNSENDVALNDATKATNDINNANADIEEEFEQAWKDAKVRSKEFKKMQQRALADFIYVFEADSRSRCAHAENTRVIELNDYEILEITRDKDESNEIGYQFEVIPCKSAAIGL
ncbi:hypothetical protein [Alteromonas gracilis]|uniref:hypothetical protein n=1 Tax=Alteromonas gracilis TaxID=1479524 RepID=UPI00321AAEE2